MQIDGRQSDQFSQALRNAFTPAELERLLWYKLNRRLSDFAGQGDAQQVAFQLIDAANRGEWIDQLILAARESAPTNNLLFVFAQQFKLGSTPASRQQLERVIVEANATLNPAEFRALLGALEPRVCRLEIRTGSRLVYSTGFLVGPRVVMTNHHVIADLIPPTTAGGTGNPPSVNALARFDYKRMYDAFGNAVGTHEGRTCKFEDDWLIDYSPSTPTSSQTEADALDYALIRLAEPVGDDRLDGGAKQETPVRRGFVDMPRAAHDFLPESSLFILQHPRGSPLQLALETKSVLGVFENGARVRYTTNTEPGSSGSPCFTAKWELAALHSSGDPDFDPGHKPTYNEGIPISAILASVRRHGHADAIGLEED
jgi:hypothetical protein